MRAYFFLTTPFSLSLQDRLAAALLPTSSRFRSFVFFPSLLPNPTPLQNLNLPPGNLY